MLLKKYAKICISIIATIILSYWLVSAWTNLWTVTSWTSLTDTIWNNMIIQLNDVWQRSSGIFTDGSWNVWVWTNTPYAKLDVSGNFIRTISHSTNTSVGSDLDNGQITDRVLNFNKLKADTDMRINYSDNFRVIWASKACTWEIKIDWNSCGTPLKYTIYSNNYNIHRPHSFLWYCTWLSAWSHQIQIYVSSNISWFSWGDCYTWWDESTWTLETEEVN